jgi:hypothetical protein
MSGRPALHVDTSRSRGLRLLFATVALAGMSLGCDADPAPVKPAAGNDALSKKTTVGKNVYLVVPKDGSARRVVVNATVVLREGQLEGFLTRKNSKEHEYILASDCDARDIHTALLAAGGEAGSPVKFGRGDRYAPAWGSVINISVRYKDKAGKEVTVPAQDWIRNALNKKVMQHLWVFAGSRLIPDPDGKAKPFYAANSGDLICVCNMPDAMLDLPVKNPNTEPESRIYEAFTERIPPVGTKVEVILEVTAEKKEAPKKDAEKSDNEGKEKTDNQDSDKSK